MMISKNALFGIHKDQQQVGYHPKYNTPIFSTIYYIVAIEPNGNRYQHYVGTWACITNSDTGEFYHQAFYNGRRMATINDENDLLNLSSDIIQTLNVTNQPNSIDWLPTNHTEHAP